MYQWSTTTCIVQLNHTPQMAQASAAANCRVSSCRTKLLTSAATAIAVFIFPSPSPPQHPVAAPCSRLQSGESASEGEGISPSPMLTAVLVWPLRHQVSSSSRFAELPRGEELVLSPLP